MTPLAAIALGMLGTAAVLLAGLYQFHQGWAQRNEAARRSRLEAGEAADRRLRAALDARLRTTPAGRALDRRLAAAGVDSGPAAFLGGTVLVVLTAYLAGALLFGGWPGLLIGVLAALAPLRWLDARRARRTAEFVAQLPEAARVMSNASSAGLSLPRAIEMAAAEVGEPTGDVLQRVIDELRLGQSVELALENLARRAPSREVAVLVATLVIQQRAGGDTVRALRDMAETLESRKDLRREVRTVMAGSLATGWIVAALGLVFLLLVNLLSPGVLREMAADPFGQLALLVGGGLYALGFVLVRRVTRVET